MKLYTMSLRGCATLESTYMLKCQLNISYPKKKINKDLLLCFGHLLPLKLLPISYPAVNR